MVLLILLHQIDFGISFIYATRRMVLAIVAAVPASSRMVLHTLGSLATPTRQFD
jgi:hypothetical protein